MAITKETSTSVEAAMMATVSGWRLRQKRASVRRLATCAGNRGTNRAYLENTVRHLDELGIREGHLHRILRAVEARPPGLAGDGGPDDTAAQTNIPAMQGDEV